MIKNNQTLLNDGWYILILKGEWMQKLEKNTPKKAQTKT